MKPEIKMVAVDVDGTFVRSDYTYDIPRFKRILSHTILPLEVYFVSVVKVLFDTFSFKKKYQMNDFGCHFVVASGNQYYQLRDLFPGYYDELSFVAENGAFVKDRKELVFTANIQPWDLVKVIAEVMHFNPNKTAA